MFRVAALAMFGVALVFSTAFAAGPGMKGSCGWGMGTPYNRMYNPNSVVSFSGEVAKVEMVENIKGMKGMGPGIHMMVKGDDPCSMAPIHLGPAWYIENQDTEINVGDKVTVTGSKVEMGGEDVIIAKEVKKGGETLMLRDDAGNPYWAGWRRK